MDRNLWLVCLGYFDREYQTILVIDILGSWGLDYELFENFIYYWLIRFIAYWVISLLACQLVNLSACQFVSLSADCQLVSWLSACQLIISLSADFHLVSSLSACQLIVSWFSADCHCWPLLIIADRCWSLLIIADHCWSLLIIADHCLLAIVEQIHSVSCFISCKTTWGTLVRKLTFSFFKVNSLV